MSLLVDDQDNSISIELAIQTAPCFGIAEKDALVYSEKILSLVKDNWERVAKMNGLSRREMEYMRPAFNLCFSM